MPTPTENFRIRLARRTGYSESAIQAAWPEWWSVAGEASPSAQAELRFSVARKLGLDPRSLVDEEGPRFLWDDSAKFKNFRGNDDERLAIISFGTSVSRMMLNAAPEFTPLSRVEASSIREAILATQPFVRFQDLLALLWGVGIPTVHLRVHPLVAKHMCAMAVSIRDRYSILLARDAKYPASTTFHLAHEIGHILLGHVEQDCAVIDMEDSLVNAEEADIEERAADRFALELLTGDPDFVVEKVGRGRSPQQLADQAHIAGIEHQIEPGTLALFYGYVTKEWNTVQIALSYIYRKQIPVWEVTNQVATQQLRWDLLGDENASFLKAVMGGV